jgi:microcin C transport system ATP-binding protein
MRRTIGHIKAVDGVDLDIYRGETLGVVGESGSGKSTLGYALLRLISSEGRIVVLGENVAGRSGRALRPMRKHMQIVFQDPFGSLSPRMSVREIVAEGLSVHMPSLSHDERQSKVVDVLREVGLDPDSADRYPHEFSGGQRQRIAIARALILEPAFLVLDEPTSALDVSIQAQVIDLLRDIQQRRGLTYLFISHDLRVVRALAHRLIVMRHGLVVEAGAAAEIFAAPREDYTRQLMAAAFDIAPNSD